MQKDKKKKNSLRNTQSDKYTNQSHFDSQRRHHKVGRRHNLLLPKFRQQVIMSSTNMLPLKNVKQENFFHVRLYSLFKSLQTMISWNTVIISQKYMKIEELPDCRQV